VFTASRKRAPLPPRPDIERVSSLRILGVIINDRLLAADHVTMLLSLCSSLLYEMRSLREHGPPATSLLYDIFHTTVVSRIQYATPAWSGMCLAADRARLDSILHRSKRLSYCSKELPAIADRANICEKRPGTDRSGEVRMTESGGGDLGEGVASPILTI